MQDGTLGGDPMDLLQWDQWDEWESFSAEYFVDPDVV